MKNLRLVLAVLVSWACAAPAPRLPAPGREVALEHAPALVILKVPFFNDTKALGGPASLASVMAYYDMPVDTLTLRRQAYMPRADATLPFDLVLASRAHGLKARVYSGTLDHLKAELKRGQPLIVLLDAGLGFVSKPQYAVVTGFDEQRRNFFLHMGKRKYRFYSFKRFSREWEKSARMTILLQPPSGEGVAASYGYF